MAFFAQVLGRDVVDDHCFGFAEGLNRDVVEVFFTAPAQGERTRMVVTPDTTIDQILKDGRKALGFDQEWIPDSDFTLYNEDFPDTPLKGTIGECGLVDFG